MASIGQSWSTRCTLLLLLAVVLLGRGIGAASVEWEAQATSRLNLRAAPGKDQSIVTMLTRGTTVVVMEQQGEWCKVVGKGDTTLQGWVAAAYLAKMWPPQEAASPEAAPQEVETKAPEKGMEPPPEEVQMPATPQNVTGPTAPAEKSEPSESAKPEGSEGAAPVPPQESPVEPAPAEPSEAFAPEIATEAPGIPAAAAPVAPAAEAPVGLRGLSVVLRQVVSLAAMIMACLALVFAYKAYLLAQECYRAMMRFQLRFQQTQDKSGKSSKK